MDDQTTRWLDLMAEAVRRELGADPGVSVSYLIEAGTDPVIARVVVESMAKPGGWRLVLNAETPGQPVTRPESLSPGVTGQPESH